MKATHAPLTESETVELRELLAACAGASLEFAHGVFAAVASAPTFKDVTDWLPLIVGDQLPSKAALERLFALLMRDFHACEQCLAIGVPAVPAPADHEGMTQYCKGYVRVSQSDARWKADIKAFTLTLPLALLSGYVSPESLATWDPQLAVEPDAFREKARHELSDSAARLYAYWADARAVAAEALAVPANTQVLAGEKVGRNATCPCGSWRKFKRCCGAN